MAEIKDNAQDEVTASRADAAAPLAIANKAIVLFSDGTGNSSGKLFKTNVFRLYQALDLGPGPGGQTTQIAYYDNGVGTSSIKILAILGGIFGFGLKRNVLHLYRFLCRNYNPGDTIHAFGFSRGSFTIRLLVGFICRQGIVPYEDERELHYNSADAFYRFANANAPDVFPYFWRAVHATRDLLRLIWRKIRGRPMNVPSQWMPDVDFVGVWDTVAAYGGPISEITRGIDKYVWPLTMTDYILHPKVKAARHALALDDERDSFWPLLWDEVSEQRNANDPQRTPEMRARFATRMKQVWFAGVHSDVGGGYPDDSLAYVSLVWMIDELAGRLRINAEEERRFRSFANAFGPMHDSRIGLGAYYRYQPRKIAALLHRSVEDTLAYDETRILRDPTLGEKEFRPQGLLLSCNVHESVIERIGSGTDNYAPAVLPRDFTVVGPRVAAATAATTPTVSAVGAVLANLADPAIAAARGEAQENAWDDVWRRRVIYFATVLLSLVLVLSPLYVGEVDVKPAVDARSIVDILIGWFAALVPGFAMPWYDAFRELYLLFLGVLVLIWILQSQSTAQAQRLGDALRIAWWQAIGGTVPGHGPPSRLRRFRNNYAYQFNLQQLKWRAAPFVTGVTLLLLVPYGAAVIWAQVRLAFAERSDVLCRSAAAVPITGAVILTDFSADDPCRSTGVAVTKGRRYRVYVDAPAGWRDGPFEVPARGLAGYRFPWGASLPMVAFAPFKRVVPARWLEPLVEVRPASDTPAILRLSAIDPPDAAEARRYSGEFTAPFDGSLNLFLNDAAGLWGGYHYFYNGSPLTRNEGIATICIRDAELTWRSARAAASVGGCPEDEKRWREWRRRNPPQPK